MDRRLFVATIATCCVGATAGCLEETLEEVTTFSASPAVVSQQSTAETGYEYQGTREVVREHDVARGLVETRNYASTYRRTVEVPLDIFDEDETEAGVFGVLTTPQVSIGDEQFNPIGELTPEQIVGRVQSQYEELEIDSEPTARRSVEMLGETITVETFEGEATFQGTDDVDVFVDISQPDRDGDHFVITAAFPDVPILDADAEIDRIDAMIGAIEHGDDVDAEIIDA
ncbi:DUF6517 family protein [Natrialba swarupiae]|uniref:Uncharacterized protein n=1 Tax=Natrialba swarupiae TaxID=2448032 RepID=A0A5D5AJ05_9EURY|nr:DUF6517 family protein [Natrialba swarupiae]TYT60913.1 hypothetical protein FYC77_16490 [Natrialba swarupiae]